MNVALLGTGLLGEAVAERLHAAGHSCRSITALLEKPNGCDNWALLSLQLRPRPCPRQTWYCSCWQTRPRFVPSCSIRKTVPRSAGGW